MRWRHYALVLLGCSLFFFGFFSPVIFGGRYLTWGDGLSMALPAFLGRHALWEPNIMLGYPWASNLNGYWYPLGWLNLIPNAFNAYMISAYVLAAFGAFGLVWSLTRSTLAAIVSAGVYTLSGFMTSHSGHYDIVQPAAWAPFILWSLAALKSGVRVSWIALGAIGIAMCATAGQPQVLAYTLFLALAYIVTMSLGSDRDRGFFMAALVCVVLGLGMAAVALVPAAELARESVRATLSFSDFLALSLAPAEIPIRLFFPYFLGGTRSAVYPFSSTADPFTELSIFVGIAPLMLALVAAITSWSSKEVRFWCVAALCALVLATGDGLHLGQLFYHIPILNVFRAQGRHALEFTLCAAVASGLGIAAIERGRAHVRHVLLAALVVGTSIAVTLVGIALLDRSFAQDVARAANMPELPIVPWRNPALGIPVFVFLSVSAAIVVWSQRPRPWVFRALLLGAVALDLGSYAWFGPSHVLAVASSDLTAPPYIPSLRNDLDRSHTRLLSLTGSLPPMVVAPNISLLWGIPAAGGYVQLELARTAAFLEMQPYGTVDPDVYTRDQDRALDLASVRYVAMRSASPRDRAADAPFDWDDLNQKVGAYALVPTTAFRVTLRNSIPATRVVLVSSMGDSVGIPDRAHVADLVLAEKDGGTSVFPVLSGRDTSEVAYERPDVRLVVKHARAPIFTTNGPYHTYVASFALPKRASLRNLAIRWRYPDVLHGILTIDKLSLIDDATRAAHPITTQMLLESDTSRWRRIGGTGSDALFENRAALPRAWIVHRVVASTAEQALAAIRHGSYDVRTAALVEGSPSFANHATPARERVSVAQLSAISQTLDVTCGSSCFVVTSDTYYDGWDATVDEMAARVYRADYALRGVFVPGGHHRVLFEYRPRSIAVGATVTLLALCILGLCGLRPIRKKLGWSA